MKQTRLLSLVILPLALAFTGCKPSGGRMALQKQFLEAKAKAEKGDALAQYTLGFCYANGIGVAKDEVEAVKWFRKAADQGDASAQCNLGVCYAKGQGVAKDEVEAYALWNSAAITWPDAAAARGRLETKMSPDQRAAGQRRAKELQKEIEAAQAKNAGK